MIVMEQTREQQLRERLNHERALQLAQGQAVVEQLAREHELNGYDWNVLNQWAQDHYCGQRPVLSFELRARRQAEERQAELEMLREHERAEQARQQHAQWVQLLAAQREAELDRRREYPLKAEAEDTWMEARMRQQQRRLEQERREQEQRQKEKERLLNLLRQGRTKEGILAMDESTFLEWCEEAPVTEVEAFAELLRRDGELARQPAWMRWAMKAADDMGLIQREVS